MKIIKVKFILIMLIYLSSNKLANGQTTSILEIMQADSTKHTIGKTIVEGNTFFHDWNGCIIVLNEKDNYWYYTRRIVDKQEDVEVLTSSDIYTLTNLKYGEYFNKPINEFEKIKDDSLSLFPKSIIYRVKAFTRPPPPPPPMVEEEEVYDFFAFWNKPIMLNPREMKKYVHENFPPLAIRSGVNGKVVVKFVINSKGLPDNCTVVFEKPRDMGFGSVAIKAVEQLRFQPAEQMNLKVPVRGQIKINFKN